MVAAAPTTATRRMRRVIGATYAAALGLPPEDAGVAGDPALRPVLEALRRHPALLAGFRRRREARRGRRAG